MSDPTVPLRQQIKELHDALEWRDLIGQAKGVLIATFGYSADQAFAMLSKQSQAENRELVEVAAEVVARATPNAERPPPEH